MVIGLLHFKICPSCGSFQRLNQRLNYFSGGIITEDDLNNYQVEVEDPVSITLRDGSKVYSLQPPSSGGVLAFILNILDGRFLVINLFAQCLYHTCISLKQKLGKTNKSNTKRCL